MTQTVRLTVAQAVVKFLANQYSCLLYTSDAADE